MSYKDLLVILDHSRHCRARLAVAVALARRFGTHLTGLYAIRGLDLSPFLADQFPPEALDAAHARVAQQRDDIQAMFRAATEGGGITSAWREVRGDATELAIWHARHADMAVLGQPDPEEQDAATNGVSADRFLLGTGRPTLMIPYSTAVDSLGKRILVAWNGSPQAARAVNDALPLLAAAEKVVVLKVDQGTPTVEDEGGGDLAAHLARHGIAAEMRDIAPDDIEPADVLLSYAADEGSDLIVMGVYGHSRLRELALGGVSRQMLSQMTVPVLMAH